MAYTLMFLKNSVELREARLKAEEEKEEKTPELLEALNPSADSNFQDKKEQLTSEHKTTCQKILDVLLKPLLEGFRTVMKKRPDNGRTLLILAVIIFVLEYFVIVSFSKDFFLPRAFLFAKCFFSPCRLENGVLPFCIFAKPSNGQWLNTPGTLSFWEL